MRDGRGVTVMVARWSLWCAGALLATLAGVAAAAEKPFAAPHSVAPAPAGSAGSLAQVTLSLLLVLAAVFAAAWVVRRMRGFGKFGANTIQIVADTALGPKERAVLIQVGQQQLLLGVAPGRVNMLHVLAEPVADLAGEASHGNAATPAATPHAPPDSPSFKAILKRSLGL